MVTIEESDDEKSIVTPDLRLRFRWAEDRWSHAIEGGPGPWQVVADSVEGQDIPDSPIRPTYQELHFQADGNGVVALAVGRRGSHHFSASFRVQFRAYRQPHFMLESAFQDRSQSRIEVDVADRTRGPESVEALYRIHHATASLLLSPPGGFTSPEGFPDDWRRYLAELSEARVASDRVAGYLTEGTSNRLVWEARLPENYDVSLGASPKPSASFLTYLDRARPDLDRVRISPFPEPGTGTHRFGYVWSHNRVKAARKDEETGDDPPWCLPGCDAPDDLGMEQSSS